jgi:hypothetical protein
MCIACELGFWIAMDALPDGPPPGFPGARAAPDDAARFTCDTPDGTKPAPDAGSREDEPAP